MRHSTLLAVIFLSITAFIPNAHAIPVQFPGNGHFYDAISVPGGISWQDARDAAASMTFMGLQGHLATITSADEQQFLNDTFPGTHGFILGGFQPPGSPEPGGGWQWVTGEPFVYTNWGPIEPNNSGGIEDVLITAQSDRPPFGSWNDTNSQPGTVEPGYFIEYEAAQTIEVPIDIKPQSCPNPLNVKSRGVLSVAILGTADFDVLEVDPASVRLEGVAPLRSALEDVATPFVPFTRKTDASDCTDEGPDGFDELTLKFRTQDIVAALGAVSDGDVLVLELTGNLNDGTPMVGEDVVVILKKGKK